MAWIRRMLSKITLRALFILLGFVALVILVWFGGPLLAIADWKPFESVLARVTFLLLLVISYLAIQLWRTRRERKDNERVVSEMMASEEGDELLREELETQRNNLRKALALVRKWKPGRFRSVYELPWYMIVGAPGSGKSTALLNSGLEFPLKSEMGLDSVKGVGGTRYCDWWFTNRAVIIDTAGRYTTQESGDKRDAKGWNAFLGLLKKYRSRQPINGVIVAVSVADLLEQTPTEQALHARAIKQRVQELKNRLGVVFPVYVMLTKFDLLDGFVDTFGMLSEQEREDVLGLTFELDSVKDPERLPVVFDEEFNQLLGRLSHFLLHRLQQERAPDTRRRVYEFPKQVALLKAPLWNLLKDVFFPSAYEEVPLLRGVYMVSSEQGQPAFDKVSGLVDQQFKLQTPKEKRDLRGVPDDGFFQRKLFDQIIFSEHGLAVTDRSKAKQMTLTRRIAFAAMAVLTVGLATAWYLDYAKARDSIDQFAARTESLDQHLDKVPEEADWLVLEGLLDESAQLVGGEAETAMPGFSSLGYFQVQGLRQAAEGVHGRVMQYRLGGTLKRTLEEDIRLHLDNPEYLYEALKSYLMMGDRSRYNEQQVALWLEYLLSQQLPGEINRPQREALLAHLQDYLALEQPLRVSNSLVEQARNELTAVPLAERAYQRIKMDAQAAGLPEFRLPMVLGTVASEVFERRSGESLHEGIPALYTKSGYQGVFEPERDQIVSHLLEDSWVYGEDSKDYRNLDEARIKSLVEDQYFRDYIYTWESFLSDLKIRSFGSPEQGRYLTNLLSGPDAPLNRLVSAVKYNTQLSLDTGDNSAQMDAAKDQAMEEATRKSRAFDRLNRLMPLAGEEPQQTTLVDDAFKVMHNIKEETFQSLQDKTRIMSRYFAEQASGGNNFQTVSRADFNAAVTGFYATVSNTQSSHLESIVSGFARESRGLVRTSATQKINGLWRNEVYREYSSAIAGLYPVDPSASEEISLADFSQFFGYGGTVDNFFQQYVAEHVDTSRTPWKLSTDLNIRGSSLRFFQRASRIREAFFVEGTKTLRVPFSVQTVYLDNRVTQFSFEAGGNELNYRHGPARRHPFVWPGDTNGGVRVAVNPGSTSDAVVQRSFQGEWALFHMLDAYDGLSGEGRELTLEVMLSDYLARIKVEPSSVKHPFRSGLVQNFTLPSRL
ncbi:type VI secretion system membrane subunit TssM [Marinobacter sp. CA1]|uniref:type VI secretion system membrane subunit TssM n=1 Tax=Marinobacter sp. CA1 TaxID=2817656 RepID=UPI001D0667A9|nr:type VI secretion system membrane subunit TssM [Marinobacter sp. CA1]UDL04795.1 type VI secretion system membrane subunit TssM [Marinobacter sp. CA1]